jgi:hypothetical protein
MRIEYDRSANTLTVILRDGPVTEGVTFSTVG